MTTVRMAAMTRTELRAVGDAGGLLVIPIGSTEQHGEHLGVGTDHLVSEAVALRAAERIRSAADAHGRPPSVVVAPTLAYGHSHHHLPFGGTISLTPATFQQVLVELGCTAVDSGFHRLFFLNGHGGNVEIAATAAREIARIKGVPVGSGSYWIMARDRLDALGAAEHGVVPGHAGQFETSLALAIDPITVRDERPSRHDESGQPSRAVGRYDAAIPWFWHEIDGWTDDAAAATADAGNRYLDVIVDAVVEGLADFGMQADHAPGDWQRQ